MLADKMGPGLGGQLLRFAGGPPGRGRGREVVGDRVQDMIAPETDIPEAKFLSIYCPVLRTSAASTTTLIMS